MKFLLFCYVIISKVFAADLTLPQPTGPYSVGTHAIEFKDPTRTMLRGTETRRWMAQIFYPAEKHTETSPYMPDTLEDGQVSDIKVLTWSKPNVDPILQKFPVIIFMPGRGAQRQQYTILLEELASQGYVVIAIDQPYVANFVKFPDGQRISLTLKDAWYLPRDRDYRYQYDDLVIGSEIADIKYIIDHLQDSKVLADLCNPSEIILMGHSIGGNIAHILGFEDKHITAVIDIDSKITERKIYNQIGVPQNPNHVPVLFIRGALQYQEDVHDQLTKTSSSTVWAPAVQHSAFSDNAFFAANIPNFGQQGYIYDVFNWLLKRGPYWDKIDTSLGTYAVENWYNEYRQYVVNWLKKNSTTTHRS